MNLMNMEDAKEILENNPTVEQLEKLDKYELLFVTHYLKLECTSTKK